MAAKFEDFDPQLRLELGDPFGGTLAQSGRRPRGRRRLTDSCSQDVAAYERLPSMRSALDGVSGPLGPGRFLNPRGRHATHMQQPPTSIFRSEGDAFRSS
jgi:hypothetical protein